MQVNSATLLIDGVAKAAGKAVVRSEGDFMALMRQVQENAANARAEAANATAARGDDKADAAREPAARRRDETTERRGSERAQSVRQASPTKHADNSGKAAAPDETEATEDSEQKVAAPTDPQEPAANTAEQPVVVVDEQPVVTPDPAAVVAAPAEAGAQPAADGEVGEALQPALQAPAATPAAVAGTPSARSLAKLAAEAGGQSPLKAAELAAADAMPADAEAPLVPTQTAAKATTSTGAADTTLAAHLSAGDRVEVTVDAAVAANGQAASTRAGLTANAASVQEAAADAPVATASFVTADDGAGQETGAQPGFDRAFDHAAAEEALAQSADDAAAMQGSDDAGVAMPAGRAPALAAGMAAAEASAPGSASAATSTSAPTVVAGVTGIAQADGAGRAAATPAAVRAAPHQPVQQQVAVQIGRAIEQGKDSISIKLRPLTMGTVEVKLAVEDGRVSAVVTCDNRDTFELLQRDARGMEKALQDAGLQTDANSLSFSLKGGEGREAQASDGHHRFGRNGRGAGRDGSAEQEQQQQATSRSFGSDRGLDIRV